MDSRRWSSIALLIALALGAAAWAQAPLPSGRLEAGREWIAAASLPPRMSFEDFVRLSILASLSDPATGSLPAGAEEAERAARIAFMDLAMKWSADPAQANSSAAARVYDKAASILEGLHRSGAFRSYAETQTRVDALLSSGLYNCVSSAVVYAGLLKAVGIEAEGVQTPDHAFVRVMTEEGWIDAETTTSLGFDPGKRKEVFTDAFGRTTGFTYLPPTHYSQRTVLDERGLIALVLHNRYTALQRSGRHDLAFGLALDRQALEGGGGESTEMLRVAALNWIGSVDNAGRSAEALALLSSIQDRLGSWKALESLKANVISNHLARLGREARWDEGWAFIEASRKAGAVHPAFDDFAMVSLNNRAVALANAGRAGEALDFIRASIALGRAPDAVAAAALREGMALSLLSQLSRTASFSEGLEAAKALRDGGDLSGPALERGLQAIGAAEANRLAREDPARGWLKAAEAFERAMALAPGSALLSQSARMASQNQETAFHNSFAAAYNAGRYEEAASLLREALALMPQSARLRSDLEAAERMIGR